MKKKANLPDESFSAANQSRVEQLQHTIKIPTTCPYCEGSKIIRKGKRKNKYGDIQLYFCHHCKKKFTPLVNKHRTFPFRVILEALCLYNQLYSYAEVANALSAKYGVSLSRQNVALWVADFKDHLTFLKHRSAIAKKYTKHDMILEARLLHGLVYAYKYHRAKTNRIIYVNKNHAAFKPMQDFLESIPKTCPHSLFRKQKSRASTQNKKEQFDLDGVVITPRHENAAIKSARFVIQAVSNNKRRHDILQHFMLTNDSATIAIEVPVFLKAQDLANFMEKGYENIPISLPHGGVITGHIDIVQIRYGLIHILDYKPGARRDKPIEQLMVYALALSHLTGIDLYHFKCAWFDDQDYFEFYPRTVVKKQKHISQ